MKLESELKHNGVHEANVKSSRTVRGQMLEAESEAKDKSSRPRPRPRPGTKFWPRRQLGLEDLTSLVTLAVSATVFEIFTVKQRKRLILLTPPVFNAL